MQVFLQESKEVCSYEMEGPGIPALHNAGSLSATSTSATSSGQAPESPTQGGLILHPHLTSGRNLEIMWSKSHLVMRMIEMRIGQEPLLQVWSVFQFFCCCCKYVLWMLWSYELSCHTLCWFFFFLGFPSVLGKMVKLQTNFVEDDLVVFLVLFINRYSTNCCHLLTVQHSQKLITAFGQTYYCQPVG